jgi:hypothetical protein
VDSDRVWTHENGESIHPDWMSRRFKRLMELSGLPPVRLHDLRHLSATLSLLAKNDIKVVQERLGHSSRQVTSDTYTSVLPELMRAEAESMAAVVPREITFDVRRPLRVPARSFRGDVAVFFAHGTHLKGRGWSIVAKPHPDSKPLGRIHAASRGQEEASEAAVKWVRDYCAQHDLELLRVENLNGELPGEDAALLRFTVGRSSGTEITAWGCPAGSV